jgi:hypothetical protein
LLSDPLLKPIDRINLEEANPTQHVSVQLAQIGHGNVGIMMANRSGNITRAPFAIAPVTLAAVLKCQSPLNFFKFNIRDSTSRNPGLT